MRVALVGFFVLLASCGAGEVELETYQIGDTTKLASHCAAADPVLAGGIEGLPSANDTEPERVARILAESKQDLLAAYDGIEARVAPRNGQVASGLAGPAAVTVAEDSLIIVEISGDALCPTGPVFWNGVPLVFFRDGYFD